MGAVESTIEATDRETGQVVPFMALVVMLAIVAILAVARVGSALDDSARARTAADAAALAGVVDGREAARDMAAANGGELLEFRSDGRTAWVEVRVGGATARASAVAEVFIS